jgi:hypothetical protein
LANNVEQALLALYDNIDFGVCEICKKCRAENPKLFPKAVGAWFVGDKFEKQEKRVLFIGKNARGNPANDNEENKNDKNFLNEFCYSRKSLWAKAWHNWSYTKEISRRLFDSAGMEAIAFTNMVKCNSSVTTDTTTDFMKNCCIRDLGVVKKEILTIQPTHIVFYTNSWYDCWLQYAFDSINCMKTESMTIGKKKMPYAEYACKLGDAEIKALRIGHPERMQKEAYISTVVDWIKNN